MLVDAVQGLLPLALLTVSRVLLGLLGGVDHATDQDDLVARVVLEGEGEGAVGLDLLLFSVLLRRFVLLVFLFVVVLRRELAAVAVQTRLAALVLAEVLVEDILVLELALVILLLLLVILVVFLVLFGLVLTVLALVLRFVLARLSAGGADSLFVDLDGSLMDQLVDVQFLLSLLVVLLVLMLLLLAVDSAQVGLVGVEHILDSLFAQRLLGVQFVLDLELGQLNADVFLLLFGLFQQLFQLLSVLDLSFLHLVQTVLVLGHDHVQGQFLLLSGQTDHLQLLVFVIIESALALEHLDGLRLLATQRVESSLARLLLLTELTSPTSFHLGRVDHDQFGVLGDGVLRNGLLQFVLGLLGDVAIDLLTALLGLTLEVAFLHLDVQAGLDGLDELALGLVALVDHDGGGRLHFGLLLLSGLLALNGILALEALLEGGVGLTDLVLVQTCAGDALQLAFGLSASSPLNGGQSQLERGRRDDGVLVVVLLLGLLVQFGGQLDVGLFQFLEQLVFGLALVALLLLATALLLALLVVVGSGVLIVLFVVLLLLLLTLALIIVLVAFLLVIVVVQVQASVSLTARTLLTLLVVFVFLVVLLVLFIDEIAELLLATRAAIALLLLLALQIAQQTLELATVGNGLAGESHGQAQGDQE